MGSIKELKDAPLDFRGQSLYSGDRVIFTSGSDLQYGIIIRAGVSKCYIEKRQKNWEVFNPPRAYGANTHIFNYKIIKQRELE